MPGQHGCRGMWSYLLWSCDQNLNWHIEAETKWPPFHRWHFQTHSLVMKRIEFQLKFHLPGKFVPKGPINNTPALVQIMAWHWPGNKPLSEPNLVRLMMHICVTRPQWVKAIWYFHRIWIRMMMGKIGGEKVLRIRIYLPVHSLDYDMISSEYYFKKNVTVKSLI